MNFKKHDYRFKLSSTNNFTWTEDDVDKYYDNVSISINNKIVGTISNIYIIPSFNPAPIYYIPGMSHELKDRLTGNHYGRFAVSKLDQYILTNYIDNNDMINLITINFNKYSKNNDKLENINLLSGFEHFIYYKNISKDKQVCFITKNVNEI